MKIFNTIMTVLLIPMLFMFNIALANPPGERILKASIRFGMTDEALIYLLENTNPDLTLTDPLMKRTALQHAIDKGRTNMVVLLLKNPGLDINSKDKDGKTALDIAIMRNNPEIIQMLRNKGAIESKELGRFSKTSREILLKNKSIEAIISPGEKSDIDKVNRIKNIVDTVDLKNPNEKEALAKFKLISNIAGMSDSVLKQKRERASNSKKEAMLKIKTMNAFSGSNDSSDRTVNEDVTIDHSDDGEKAIDRLKVIKTLLDAGWGRFGTNDKNSPPDKKDAAEADSKLKAISDLTDLDESREESNVTVEAALKKAKIIASFKNIADMARIKSNLEKINGEEDKAKEKAKIEANIRINNEKNDTNLNVTNYSGDGKYTQAGRALDKAFARMTIENRNRNQHLKRTLGPRVLQCGIFRILGKNELPDGQNITVNEKGERVESYSSATVSLGIFDRKETDIRLTYNNRGDSVYLDLTRGGAGVSKIKLKNYISDNQKATYHINVDVMQNFHMKDLESGKDLLVPFNSADGALRWVTCNLLNL